MKKINIVDILIPLFVLLFIYTASAKLIYFSENVKAMHNQPLARWLTDILIYAIPILEIIIVLLLCINKTKLVGLYLFTLTMAVFTGYVALVLSNHYGKVPCSCGGILKQLKWESHLYINSIFTLLGIVAIYLTKVSKKSSNRIRAASIS